MVNLINKLKAIAARAPKSDALVLEAAIERIRKLETKLSDHEDDITDWKDSVETRMGRRKKDI